MSYLTADQILAEVNALGLRKALFVTALPIEMRAVRAHLSEIGSHDSVSGSVYEVGYFSEEESVQGENWLVVVAECGPGTHAAQGVVLNAQAQFGGFEVVVFVGVAASRKQDVPIGSVVASRQLYYPYAGKYENGEFLARPRNIPVITRLVGLASKVERDGKWVGRILPPLGVRKPKRSIYPKPFPPGAVVAPIISVESVAADVSSDLEAMIKKHYGDAHALEMEGYGAAHAASGLGIPFTVIRGISDMGGAEKTPENDSVFQPVAAMHAAAFAFELLAEVSRSDRQQKGGAKAGVAPPSDQLPATAVAAELTPAGRLVLAFDGEPEDFPPERIEEILEAIRRETGVNGIRAVGSEKGSFRLIIEGSPEDLAKVGSDAVRETLKDEHQARLIGTLDGHSYQAAKAWDEELRRASVELTSWPKFLPDGTWLDRPERGELLTVLEGEEPSVTALLGPPGAGKSALLATIATDLEAKGWPVLAIKADLLSPDVNSEAALRDSLGLSALPSDMLVTLSNLKPVALLIDQLDALAGYVDLKTGRLNALLNLVRKLGMRSNIHIVLSARTFEFEHDVRLRSIQAKSLDLKLPTWEVVEATLKEQGVLTGGWPTDAKEVLRTPQALNIFLKLADRSVAPGSSYQSMLDRIWSDRILKHSHGPNLSKVLSDIAEEMASSETLWLAASRYDSQAAEIETLEGLGLLIRNGGSIGFAHQTLFEHALARNFARGEGRLSSYVLARTGSLFVRPKLWAALTYLRDVEEASYLREFAVIWNEPRLRLHLRHLLIEFLGQQAAPTAQEEVFMVDALTERSTRDVALRSIIGSPGWFERLATAHLKPAMTADKKSASALVPILGRAWASAPDRIAQMLRSEWLPDTDYDGHAFAVLGDAPTWNADLTDIGTTILRRTELTRFSIDNLIATVGLAQPEIALELAMAKLDRDMAWAEGEAQKRELVEPPPGEDLAAAMRRMHDSPAQPFERLIENGHDWDGLQALAAAAPQLTLEALWPWFERLFRNLRAATRGDYGLGFALPYRVDFRFDGETEHDLPEPPLLSALRIAAEGYAAADAQGFIEWVERYGAEDATAAQRLFAHVLTSRPAEFASYALRFFEENTERFNLGTSSNFNRTSARLVEAVSPYWSEAELRRFEKLVQGYNPAPPRPDLATGNGRRILNRTVKWTRLRLLAALPADRTSARVRKKVEAAKEALAEEDARRGMRGGFIGSPISVQTMQAGTNEAIVSAFQELPDETGWHNPGDWLKGGNVQLSREFAAFAKQNPDRAAEVLKGLQPEFGSRAAGYALDALAEEKSVDPQLVQKLFLDLLSRGFSEREFRGSASRAVYHLASRDIAVDETILSALEGWLEVPDQENVESDIDTGTKAEDTDKAAARNADARSILWDQFGARFLPGGNFTILDAIFRARFVLRQQDQIIETLERHLARGDKQSLWMAMLPLLIHLRPNDVDRHARFIEELFETYPELIGTPEAGYYLAYAQWMIPDALGRILGKWRPVEDWAAQQLYAELIALVAVSQPDIGWATRELDRLLDGDATEDHFVGIAHAIANLWGEKRNAIVSKIGTRLMPNISGRPWYGIFDFFRVNDELSADPDTIAFLASFADNFSRAPNLNPTFLIEHLEAFLPNQAPLVARIAEGLTVKSRQDLADIRTGTAAAAPQIVDLALTLHRLEPTREAGTWLFEEMLKIDAQMARQTLRQIDNRFEESARPVRQRLPRRVRRQRGRKQS